MKGNCASINGIIKWGIVAASFFIFVGCNGDRDTRGGPSGPVPVSVVTLKHQDVELSVTLPGRTSALRIAEIRPQVNGLIEKRFFREGSDVERGQLLYQIDPSEFEAALENAKAALSKAEANLPAAEARAKRLEKLLARDATSKQDYDDAVAFLNQLKSEVEFWKAQVKSAQINLNYTRITAPISGRIGPSNVTEGAIVTAYQPTPLAVIQQLDPIYVDVPRSTAELLRLRHDLESGKIIRNEKDVVKVGLILEDGSKYPYEGTFKFQDVSVDATTGSVTMRMVFPNPESVLLPRMFVRVVIKEGVREKAILVPQQAVGRLPKGEPYVLVVSKDGKAEMRMIELDRAIGDKWLVTGGLSEGDRVIVEGLQFLRPGMPVRVVPPDAKSKEQMSGREKFNRDAYRKGG